MCVHNETEIGTALLCNQLFYRLNQGEGSLLWLYTKPLQSGSYLYINSVTYPSCKSQILAVLVVRWSWKFMEARHFFFFFFTCTCENKESSRVYVQVEKAELLPSRGWGSSEGGTTVWHTLTCNREWVLSQSDSLHARTLESLPSTATRAHWNMWYCSFVTVI